MALVKRQSRAALNVCNPGNYSDTLRGLSLSVCFRVLVRLPEQPIRVISVTDESLPLLHVESAKKNKNKMFVIHCELFLILNIITVFLSEKLKSDQIHFFCSFLWLVSNMAFSGFTNCTVKKVTHVILYSVILNMMARY